MKEILDLYFENKEYIENYITETFDKNIQSFNDHKEENFITIFNTLDSLELVYIIDEKTKKQTSSNIYKNKIDSSPKGESRDYLTTNLFENKKDDTSFTIPYESAATKHLCISMAKKEDGQLFFFDFDLLKLLQKLELVDSNTNFRTMTKSFYALTGYSMVFLSLFIISYAMYNFITSFFTAETITMESIFRPIIALTLGLAVFDLAKTVLEKEVYFKIYSQNTTLEAKTFIKFLISIIIALSIEALIVVFKISIEDYDKMINALYLISGVSIFILALAVFIYLSSKKIK